MGNTNSRLVTGLDQIVGILAGSEILDKLKAALHDQNVFNTIFGTLENSRIYIDEFPAVNETNLPRWELQMDSEIVQGSDLRQTGFINGRILFPNNLSSQFKVYRLVCLAISRWFDSKVAVDDFVRKVPGLIECGENLEFLYDQRYNFGAGTCPAVIMRIPYTLDLRRMRIEDGCTDLDGDLDAKLLATIKHYFIEITDDEGNVLIEKSKLSSANGG